jgi:hypothetical protein
LAQVNLSRCREARGGASGFGEGGKADMCFQGSDARAVSTVVGGTPVVVIDVDANDIVNGLTGPTTISASITDNSLLASKNSEVLIFTSCLSKLMNNDGSGCPNIVGSTGGVVFPSDAKDTLNEGVTLCGSAGHDMIDSVLGVLGYVAGAGGGTLNFGSATGNTLAFAATFSSGDISLIQENSGDTVVANSGSGIFTNGNNDTFSFVNIFITVTSTLDMTKGTFSDGLTRFQVSPITTATRTAGGVTLTLSDNTEITFSI